MSTNYEINFSEPLKQGFTISAGGRNGPGDANADSSLRLYGRNALDWGEAVNEDLLRLVENFASASPPGNAITGQLWAEWSLYYKDTTAVDVGSVSFGWWRWNIQTGVWEELKRDNNSGTTASEGIPRANTTFVDNQPQPNPQQQESVGTYYVDSVTGVLRGYYSLGKYENPGWLLRSYITGAGSPPSTLKPPVTIRIFDEAAGGVWATPSTTATSAVEPIPSYTGMFWYNPVSGVLKVRTSAAAAGTLDDKWHDVLGPSNGSTSTVSRGNVDMDNNRITSLADPTAPTDAVNVQYLNNVVQSGYLPITGGTITGNLIVNGSTTAKGGVDLDSTGGVTNMVDRSTFATYGQFEAVPRKYIEEYTTDAIAAAFASAPAANVNPAGTYKAGDIWVDAGRIYIAIGSGSGPAPGGNWRQVFPAVYS